MKRKIVNGNSLKASSTNDSLEQSHVKDDDDDDHDNNNFPKRNKFNNVNIGKKNEANLTDFTRYSSTNVPMVIDSNPTSTTTSQTESSTENISSIANSFGAEAKIKFREIAPPVNNNYEINRVLRESAITVLGQKNVIELQKPSLGAEDFAEFLNNVPGAMFRLGVSKSNGCAPLHSSKFDPDERAIAVGIKVITESIVKLNN